MSPPKDSDLLQAALAYAKRGWPIFPCRKDKTPRTLRGVLDATTDPEIIRKWWSKWPRSNIGLDVGSAGMMVLDLDPGHDLEELEKNVGKLPDTNLRASTPRGGEHLFFALTPGELASPSASKLAPHVDVRSFHSYVLLAPSETTDGAYAWEANGKAAHRTDRLYEVANAAVEKDPNRDEWLVKPDLLENIERAVVWLRKEARLAVEGHGGDSATYATAAMMKSYGLSEERALEVLLEEWNPQCSPPWEPDDLAIKVANAYRYNTSPPGNVTPAYHAAKAAAQFQPRVEAMGSGLQVEAGRFRFADREGVEAIPAPIWLVPELLTEGAYGLLVGPRSTLKTFLALDVALTVATGGLQPWEEGEWVGMWEPVEKPGAVLFVAGEGRPALRQRVRAWEKLHRAGELARLFFLADPVPRVLDGAPSLDAFVGGALRMNPDGYRMIVLDTVGRAMQGVNENAQETASAFTAIVERLIRELGAVVLAVHHTGHEHLGRGRGSSVFEADADVVVAVSRPRPEGRYVRLAMTKQKDAAAWDKPRWAEARTVRLGLEEESLAVVRAKEEKVEIAEAEISGRRQLAMEVVDARVMEVLLAHPLREMSHAELSRKIAAWRPETSPGQLGETLGVTDQQIRKTWLPRLRAEECLSREHYDVSKDRWRYVPPRGKDE